MSPVDERGVGVELRDKGTKESARKLVSMLAEVKRSGVLSDLEAGRVEGVEGECVVLTADQVVTHPVLGILEKVRRQAKEATSEVMSVASRKGGSVRGVRHSVRVGKERRSGLVHSHIHTHTTPSPLTCSRPQSSCPPTPPTPP